MLKIGILPDRVDRRSGRLVNEKDRSLALILTEASMTVQVQRPLLVGGIGLTLGLWGLDSVYHSLSGVGDWLTLGTIIAGGSYWWYSRQSKQVTAAPDLKEIDRTTLDRVISQVELVISQLAIESPQSTQIDPLKQQLTQIKHNLI